MTDANKNSSDAMLALESLRTAQTKIYHAFTSHKLTETHSQEMITQVKEYIFDLMTAEKSLLEAKSDSDILAASDRLATVTLNIEKFTDAIVQELG